jgi:hypothetical protein
MPDATRPDRSPFGLAEPDADQRRDRNHHQNGVDEDQRRRVYAWRIGHWRRRPGIVMPPHPRAETKNAEQDKYATGCHDQPIRQGAHQECLGTDAARHGDKASAYPRGIGPFSGEYGAVGSKLGAAVGTVFDARRAALHVGRAVLYSDGAVLELLTVLDNLRF